MPSRAMPIFLHRSAITFHSMRRTSINRAFAAPAEDIRLGEIAHRTAWVHDLESLNLQTPVGPCCRAAHYAR